MSMGLTPQLARVLSFIKARIAADGVAPSIREIGAHMGSKSISSVYAWVAGLEARGHIRRTPGAHRAIEIAESSDPFDVAREAFARVGANPSAAHLARVAEILTEARNAA